MKDDIFSNYTIKSEYRVGVDIYRFDRQLKGWCKIQFETLEDGDIFSIYESDGTRKADSLGNTVWIAKGKPYENKYGILEIKTIF